MITAKQNIYIDESGTPVLNNECYVICAVACNEEDKELNYNRLKTIQKKHRGGAELKSSVVGGRVDKRKNICTELSELSLQCVVLIIHKELFLKDSGMAYKRSAYKYCQRRLFDRIYRGMCRVEVILDNFGNEEFRNGFIRYIDKYFTYSIFNPDKNITFSSPKDTEMLQVSDFVGGTVRRFAQGDDDREAFDALEPILAIVDVWPRTPKFPRVEEDYEEFDLDIEKHCTNASLECLESEKDQLLAEALRFLLYSSSDDENSFIYGDSLLNHLVAEGFADNGKDKHWLQNNIIAPLRAKGAPIAASRSGYKIPRKRSDLVDFVQFVSQKTLPYLERVNDMRHSLSLY